MLPCCHALSAIPAFPPTHDVTALGRTCTDQTEISATAAGCSGRRRTIPCAGRRRAFRPILRVPTWPKGAEHYAAMCTMCHGGLGNEPPNYIGLGLKPTPPDLQVAAGDWKPGEIYWIIEHGIKMTGMPAFGKTHSPEQLTNITAFVVKMPMMTASSCSAESAFQGRSTRPSRTGPTVLVQRLSARPFAEQPGGR